MLPVAYDAASRLGTYAITLNGILGPAFTLSVAWGLTTDGWHGFRRLGCFTAGINQVLSYDPPDNGFLNLYDSFYSYNRADYEAITGSLCYPANYLYVQAYRWTDPAPKPPPSFPF